MAKPDITEVAANFEQMVGEMHAQMQSQRKEMLAGVDLSAFKNMQHGGDEFGGAQAGASKQRTRDDGGIV